MPADPNQERDDDLFDGLLAGSLSPREQQQLAARLRAEPALRRRLRAWTAFTGSMAQATRPRSTPLTPSERLDATPPPRPWWNTRTRFALASAAVLLIAAGSATWYGMSEVVNAESTIPETTVAGDGSFAASDAPSTIRLANHARIDLDPGTSGRILPPGQAGRDAVVRLDSGGARVHPGTASEHGISIAMGPDTIATHGEVSVQYLEAPEGKLPAVEVAVTQGQARVDSAAGLRHELRKGDTHLIPGGSAIRAEVVQVSSERQEVVLGASRGKRRWTLPFAQQGIATSDGRQIAATALEPEWKVNLFLDRIAAQVQTIEVPDQTVAGTVMAWDADSRRLGLKPPGAHDARTWAIAPAQPTELIRLGANLRLRYDPLSREVKRISPFEVEPHKAGNPGHGPGAGAAAGENRGNNGAP